MILGGSWWFMEVLDHSGGFCWLFLVVFGGSRWFMVVLGGLLQLFVALGGRLWL